MALVTAQRTEQVLEAMNYYFGGKHCLKMTVDGSAPDSSYFLVNYIDENHEEVEGYIWLNEAGSDPAPAGKTLLQEISVTDLTDASGTASEIAAGMSANVYVSASVSGVEVTLENKYLGEVTAWADFDTGYTFEVLAEGFGGSLGSAALGGSTLTTSEEVVDIQSDQTGAIILDQISRGVALSLEVTLLEMTQERWESLIGKVSGDIETIGSDDLVGYGTSKLYRSKFDFAGMLVMHPIRLANTDRSADVVIHKTAPQMNSINYSGQDVQGAEFTFSAYKDATKPDSVNLMSRGDYTLL